MKKVFIVLLVLISCVSSISEAAYYYLWNNDDYIAWINDRTIETNEIHTAAKFDIVMENRRNKTQSIASGKNVIYKDSGEWYFYIENGNMAPERISFYEGWWQPYGLEWLLDHKFLVQ